MSLLKCDHSHGYKNENFMKNNRGLSNCAVAFDSVKRAMNNHIKRNQAIYSLRAETILLPLKFATLVGQAFNSITTIQSDMNKCGLEIVNTILDQSIQSGKAINNCIKEQYVVSGSNSTIAV